MKHQRPLASIPDNELLQRLVELTSESRRVESDLVAHIAEVDERRLYARGAFPSMFAYCTQCVHLSEAEAYLRIEAARASREHPILLTMLSDGRLHLSGIAKLSPHLTRENAATLLARAAHKSKRQIEELIAEMAPKLDVPAVMRKLPERRESVAPAPNPPISPQPPAPAVVERRRDSGDSSESGAEPVASVLQLRPDGVELTEAATPARPAVVHPLAPARYKVQFTASADLRAKLERLQALMRSTVPGGDLATILDLVVTEKLQRLEAQRFAKTSRPRSDLADADVSPTSRRIPAAVRRFVYARDGGRCRYVDKDGKRCTERDQLEFHHRHPFGLGGDHSPQNIGLACRTHNMHLAEVDYGKTAVARYRRSGRPRVQSGDAQRRADALMFDADPSASTSGRCRGPAQE